VHVPLLAATKAAKAGEGTGDATYAVEVVEDAGGGKEDDARLAYV